MIASNTTYRVALSILAASFATAALACSSVSQSGAGGASGAAAETGGASGGGVGSGGKGASGGSTQGAAGDSGDGPGEGGAGATTGGLKSGTIDITQNPPSLPGYSMSAGFARLAAPPASSAANGIVCTSSTIGPCLVSECTFADVDAGAGAPPPASTVLDAGTLTITGAGAATAMLSFGPIAHTTMNGYSRVSDDTMKFFAGGDQIVVVGAGGADLPAFAAQTVTAPSDITLTAPICGGLTACADLDRTQDLALAWTGGGAGKLRAAFETVASDHTGSAFCDFDAQGGAGTIPKAALAALGKAGDGETTGVELFSSFSEATFTVGDIPTTFTVSSTITEASLNVKK